MSNRLMIPPAALAQHTIVLGKTGSGKSSVLRGFVEWRLREQQPVCIVDPKGDWWGLKSSADGTRAGFPVVIFGGEHADVPITAHAGAQVAELYATGNRPCIIDLGGWMPGERSRFFIDFASTLFRLTRGPRWLVIDEVHNFVPQGKVMDPDAGKMLHWGNRLITEGRGKGLTLLSASQRPQKVHKDFVTSNETLIAMRVIHELDRMAMKSWVDGAPDREKGRELLESIASMKRGEAWVWSPEIGFGPKRVTFPLFETYDSFAAPETDADQHPHGWATVDLDDVKTKLAASIEEAEAKDPVLLQRRIRELEQQLAKCGGATPANLAAEYARGREDGFEAGKAAGLALRGTSVDTLLRTIGDARASMHEELGAIEQMVETWRTNSEAMSVSAATIAAPKRDMPPAVKHPGQFAELRKSASSGDSAVGTGGLRRMLIALAQRPSGMSARALGVRAGMSSSSGTFATYLAKARTEGWIEGSRDGMRITAHGIKALGAYHPLPTGSELLAYWLSELGNSGAARLLRELARAYPRALTKDQAAERAELSASSGTFATYCAKLRTLELISGRGELKASEELFD